jgi:biofilm PGA synthesis lipoprotein PgaB
LPVTEDLFNRAAWQLLTRTRVKVYAWMPVLAFGFKLPDDWFVHEWQSAADAERSASAGLAPANGNSVLSAHSYKRLSPFNAEARRMVGEMYEDLAAHCNFSGILFHDDAVLTDYEDVTPQALRVVGRQWGLPTAQHQLRATPEMRMKWARHKTQLLVEWTDFLAGIVRKYRPDIKTARNYYALPIVQPDSEEWYAQSLQSGLDAYDYVAIEAMPTMEKAENPEAWLEALVKKVAAHPDGLRKAVFEVQTVDWNTRQKIPMQTIVRQLKLIQNLGGVHLGYYPDNVFDDHPSQEGMASAFALPRFP